MDFLYSAFVCLCMNWKPWASSTLSGTAENLEKAGKSLRKKLNNINPDNQIIENLVPCKSY